MSPRPAQWKQVEVSGAQSHSLGPKSRVLSRMTTTSPCFYEPIEFRRLLIFHKFLSFATLPFSFQTCEEAISKSGVGLIVGSRRIPYFRAAMAGLRCALVGWLSRPRKPSLRGTQLVETAFHPSPTSKSDVGCFGEKWHLDQ